MVCLHLLREYCFYTTSAGLHLSQGGLLLSFFGGLQLLISNYKGSSPFPTTGKNIFQFSISRTCLVSSLPERRSVLECTHHPTATLSLIKHEVSYLCPPALLLKLSSDTFTIHYSTFTIPSITEGHIH